MGDKQLDAIRARLADFDRLHQMPIHWNGDLFDSDGDEVVLVKARYLSRKENASVAAAILHVSDDIRALLKQHDADQKRIAELETALSIMDEFAQAYIDWYNAMPKDVERTGLLLGEFGALQAVAMNGEIAQNKARKAMGEGDNE